MMMPPSWLLQRIVEEMPEAVLLAVPAIRKDGSRISIEFSLALLRDDHGAVAGAAAIIRDVMARWERERSRN